MDYKDAHIDSLYVVIDFLSSQVDSLYQVLEVTNSKILIDDGFVIPNRYSFAGVEFDLTNDRIRSKLESIFRIEVRNAPTYIPRSGIYFPYIDSVLTSYGLHPDIKYLAVAESYLNYMAYSPVGAAGIWQFMPTTGRAFNLRIDSYMDERRNFLKATDAACRYILRSHQDLQAAGINDWLLTLASYNSGVGNIRRVVREQNARDFFSLILRHEETHNYIWRAIAVKMVFEFEDIIFPNKISRMPPLFDTARLVTVEAHGYHDLVEWATAQGTTASAVWELNPWINISRTRQGRFSPINHLVIPPGTHEILIPIDSTPDEEKLVAVLAKLQQKNNAPFITGNATQYRVQRGDSLYSIARRHGVKVEDIRRWNGLSGNMIHPGQVLHLQAR
jgi:membrane-bound lytic murein transglycosylase D